VRSSAIAIEYLLEHSAPLSLPDKGKKRQEHGMHFDGIVAGLERQRQRKMAKRRRNYF
jgi:hypothetical protein